LEQLGGREGKKNRPLMCNHNYALAYGDGFIRIMFEGASVS